MKGKTLLTLCLTFLKIGLFTIGGGYAMISILERDLVDEKKWLTAEELSNIIVVAESTPGPIMINTATYVGFKVGKVFGSVLATIAVVIPSLVIITAIYSVYGLFRDNVWVNAAFRGIHCAVVVLLVNAIAKIIKPMEKNALTIALCVVSFAVALFTDFNAIWVILIGGAIGILVKILKKEGK